MKKVLFILPSLAGGGAERVTLNLIRHLNRDLFEPTLLLFNDNRELNDELDMVIRTITVFVKKPRLRKMIPSLLLHVSRYAKESDVIVGALELDATYLALAGGRFAHKPVIGWVHTIMDSRLETEASWHRKAFRFTYPKLNKVVFVSQGAATSVDNLVAISPKQATVIPIPIELENIRVKAQELLPAWAAAIFSKPVVLGLGRLSPEKGFDLLLHAHANLRAMGVEHHLLILGEGSEREALEKLCHQLDVTDSVFMPGFFPNPYPFLRAAQVFALSSRFEGFSAVIIEALCLRVPVVAADCPSGPHELLNGGEHGMLVPLEDPAALAEGIASILRNPASAGQRTASGYERAQDFSPERVVPQWEALLRTVANE